MGEASHIDRAGGVWEFFSVKRAWIATVVAIAVVGAAAVILVRATRPAAIVLAQADRRAIEARLSEPSADRWRPYDAGRGREEVRVDVLKTLEKRGDWRGLGDAYLLAGEPARAAEALAKAGPSADAESDRAALALASKDAKAALGHATRALQLAPGHAQATWNRALALRDLGLGRTATMAFQAIAARGAPGWGAEAKERARALGAELRAREELRRAADVAGREMVKSGLAPAPELVRAYPHLIEGYLGQAMASAKLSATQKATLEPVARTLASGASRRSALALEQATSALHAGHAAEAEQQALDGFVTTLRAGYDPRDLPRRFLILAADAARAQGATARADAYVEEARQLI
jgi:hypothetical protein